MLQEDEDPKTKRKVQNRAAQRAFRERKERYVRELEAKIKRMHDTHMHATAQLSREIHYLRSVVRHLETELCNAKGIPADSMESILTANDNLVWQQQQQHLQQGNLAPFLTARPRPIAIAPATSSNPTPNAPQSSSHHHNQHANKHPRQAAHQHQHHQQGMPRLAQSSDGQRAIKPLAPSTMRVAPPRSPAALYVRFSPSEESQSHFEQGLSPSRQQRQQGQEISQQHEQPHDQPPQEQSQPQPQTQHALLPGSRDPVLYPAHSNLDYASGSASSSKAGSSKAVQVAADASSSVEKAIEKTADPQETETAKMQVVWRRLNLYGRFTDFSFDQIRRVANVVEASTRQQQHDPNMPSLLGVRDTARLEDWELDKLMHQMDPDHL